MKISAFADEFNVNVSTVRHYINSGLLVPEKKQGQYYFDRECIDDMKNILKYKNYHFSLEEIQLLFFMEKASRFKDEVVLDVCSEILKNKKKELLEEKKILEENIRSIEKDITEMPEVKTVKDVKWGVPFSFIPNLYCPECQIPLELDSASISNNYLYSGELKCNCGYNAYIEDGVIISGEKMEDTPFKAFENIESIISLKEEFSHQYRGFIAKTYMYMRDFVHNEGDEPRKIMGGPFTFNFLLEYLGRLGPHDSYIIVDPSIKRINKLKTLLSDMDCDIVYYAGSTREIPVKHGCVDIYIDDFSTVNSLFTFDEYHTDLISPFLKKKGKVAGLYTDYRKAPRGLRNFKKDNPDFTPEKMAFGRLKFDWERSGVHITDKKGTGFTNTTEKHYPRGELGEAIEVIGYCGKKV